MAVDAIAWVCQPARTLKVPAKCFLPMPGRVLIAQGPDSGLAFEYELHHRPRSIVQPKESTAADGALDLTLVLLLPLYLTGYLNLRLQRWWAIRIRTDDPDYISRLRVIRKHRIVTSVGQHRIVSSTPIQTVELPTRQTIAPDITE